MAVPVMGCAGFHSYWAIGHMTPWMCLQQPSALPMSEQASLQPAESSRRHHNNPVVTESLDVALHETLVAKLSEGGAAGDEALTRLKDCLVRLAFDPQGCLIAQGALGAAAEHQLVQLANSLQGHIVDAMTNPHANYVVQKVVQVLPTQEIRTLVVAPLAGVACDLARDQFGCRIFQSLLEKCPSRDIQSLIEELLAQVAELCCHKYGNFVIQQILENGTPEQRGFVVRTLAVNPLGFSLDKTGSNVVEKALDVCSREDRWNLFLSLTNSPATFETLACSKFGNYVARSLLYLKGEDSAAVRARLRSLLPAEGPMLTAWHRSIYGRRVLREFREADRAAEAGPHPSGPPAARPRHQQQKPWRRVGCGQGDRP